jgi:gliding motility-associated lipoprotein GldH
MLPKTTRKVLAFVLVALSLAACQTIDLYEKVETIPGHTWQSGYKPKFNFTVKDTTASYQLNIIIRHSEQYRFRNIWLNLYAQAPGDSVKKFTVELPLATPEKGWLGSGMDDLYEHQVTLTLDPSKFNFNKPGDYNFTFEQIMREDPLMYVFNIGMGIEKK